MSRPPSYGRGSRVLRLAPVALSAAELPLLAWLGAALGSRLGLATVQESPIALDPAWLDAARGQCSSNLLVDSLVARDPAGAAGLAPEDWVLAVTAVDLFAPGREFVYGEATRGGAWAVISLARLRDREAFGEEALRARALKEALHELGHLAGLDHCSHEACAMAPSATAEEIDHKPSRYCPACDEALRSTLDPGLPRS